MVGWYPHLPNLSFKRRFAPRIRAGQKRHTIRAIRTRGFRYGDDLYLWIEQRKPSREWIGFSKCAEVQEVRIDLGAEFGRLDFTIDGARLTLSEEDALARADGFDDMRALYDFWIETHGIQAFPWDGQIIHWEFPFRDYSDSPASRRKRRKERK